MTQAALDIPRKTAIARWLINPSSCVDGRVALIIGLTVIVASGPAATAGGAHFHGALHFDVTYGAPFWVPVGEGLAIWFVVSALIGLASLAFGPRPVRLVDIAGAQALARFPLLVASLLCALPVMRGVNAEVVAAAAAGQPMVPPPWAFLVAAFVGFSCGIWTIWLMWKGFSVSCHLPRGRAVALFGALYLAGDVALRLLVHRIHPQVFG